MTPPRVWAPFGAQNGSQGRSGAQKSFYDHGYRQPGEHYHRTFEELIDCPLLGDEPHLREARASRHRRQERSA
jgi:hypothetical protein